MIVHRSPFADIAISRQTISACVFAGFAGALGVEVGM